jgi:hypothetical protein
VLKENARVLAFRVDLHLPKDKQGQYSNAVIKRFIASLKAQINAYQNRRRKLEAYLSLPSELRMGERIRRDK